MALETKLPRSKVVVPVSMRADMKWAYIGSTAASTTYAETIFSGVDLTDPGLSTSTRQPVGFDELALWYGNYRNHSSVMIIKCNMTSTAVAPTATVIGGDLVIYASSTTTSASNVIDAMAQPGAKFVRLGGVNTHTITHRGSHQSVMGFRPAGVDSSVSLTATGPVGYGWVWHVCFQSDAAYTAVNIDFNILIVYDVTFFNRKLLNMSTYEERFGQFIKQNSKSWEAKGETSTISERQNIVHAPTKEGKEDLKVDSVVEKVVTSLGTVSKKFDAEKFTLVNRSKSDASFGGKYG